MPSDDLIITALTCLIDSHEKEIKRLEWALEVESNTVFFLLNIISNDESKGRIMSAIYKNEAGGYSLSEEELDGIMDYLEQNYQ